MLHPTPGFQLTSAPRHQPGHTALAITSSGEHLLNLADTVGHPILMQHPALRLQLPCIKDQRLLRARALACLSRSVIASEAEADSRGSALLSGAEDCPGIEGCAYRASSAGEAGCGTFRTRAPRARSRAANSTPSARLRSKGARAQAHSRCDIQLQQQRRDQQQGRPDRLRASAVSVILFFHCFILAWNIL